jgi:hypothetical protein
MVCGAVPDEMFRGEYYIKNKSRTTCNTENQTRVTFRRIARGNDFLDDFFGLLVTSSYSCAPAPTVIATAASSIAVRGIRRGV